MDLNEISEIIKEDGGKFIIVESGKPTLVILGFDEYREKIKKLGFNPAAASSQEVVSAGAANETEEFPADLKAEDVDIEDLPLE